VVDDLSRTKNVVTVALWDLDGRVGRLSEIAVRLNQAQPAFTFFNLHAPVPAGLIVDPAHSIEWARNRGNRRLTREERQAFDNNLMSDDFFKHAHQVHQSIGVAHLVGITRYMLAGIERGELFWNYIALTKRKTMLVSTYDLRAFAEQADRSFEVAAAALVIAQVLATVNSRVSFHRKDTGCLFDFNQSRVSLVQTLRTLEIEPFCLEKIDARYRQPAAAMLNVLRSDAKPPAALPQFTARRDDSFWLKQLSDLTKRVKKEKR
jgi:hypothetical protein